VCVCVRACECVSVCVYVWVRCVCICQGGRGGASEIELSSTGGVKSRAGGSGLVFFSD